jgi:TonB family protein
MFTRLMESQRAREQGTGARSVSVLVHVAVLGSAVYATGFAKPAPVEVTIFDTLPVYAPPVEHHGTGHAGGGRCGALCYHLPDTPVIDVPLIAPGPGPEIDLPGPVFGSVTGGDGLPGTGVIDGSPGGISETAERPAAALAGNPRPGYPALLRSAHLEATVSARFVVDTTGRVEPASIAFESAGERLFEASVRRALLASRFSPAETQGHRVRMLVRQDFAFRLTP